MLCNNGRCVPALGIFPSQPTSSHFSFERFLRSGDRDNPVCLSAPTANLPPPSSCHCYEDNIFWGELNLFYTLFLGIFSNTCLGLNCFFTIHLEFHFFFGGGAPLIDTGTTPRTSEQQYILAAESPVISPQPIPSPPRFPELNSDSQSEGGGEGQSSLSCCRSR